MSHAQVKNIVKKYAAALEKAQYPFSAMYVFGSYAKGTPNQWSDIDVAIVSDRLKRQYDANRLLLWKLRRGVDTRIEPHGFTVKDFADNANSMAYEIRRTGIRVV